MQPRSSSFDFAVDSRPRAWAWIAGLLCVSSLVPAAGAKYTPYMDQSFFFDWTPVGQSPPQPITAQCDSIHIAWQRGNAVGPNPTAPYFLQVYTSSFIVPLVIPAGDSNEQLTFDWPVPFVPGTQYQICMFDKNGYTGGCQGSYTVYQAPNHTIDDPPVCRNLTYPLQSQVLGVNPTVDNGPMSQYGWVPQCTDISLTPTNGTPPFTMTVAPALHPPYNITSNTMDAINWTVQLSWGTPFYVSLVDSSGLLWSNGPLHAGQGTSSTCLLEPGDDLAVSSGVRTWIPVVSGIGGLVVGLLLGLIGAIWFLVYRRRDSRRGRPEGLHRKSSSMSITTPVLRSQHLEPYSDNSPAPGHQHRLHDTSYRIEPFVMPSDRELGLRADSSHTPDGSGTLYDSTAHSHAISANDRSPSASVVSPTTASAQNLSVPSRPSASERQASSQVYVVHHDAGRPPVTVYTADGTEVVELPPRYNESSTGATAGGSPVRSGRTPPLQAQERRHVGSAPPKVSGLHRVVS